MSEPAAEDHGYTVEETGAKLGYTRSTVYRMIARGILGAVRAPGMDARVYQSHIDEYKRRFSCPALASKTPIIDSFAGTDGASGISRGPIKAKRSWSARELKLDLKAQNRARRP